MSRISGAEEISGHGLRVQLDGHTVLAGNGRLMEQMQVPYEECLSARNNCIYSMRKSV